MRYQMFCNKKLKETEKLIQNFDHRHRLFAMLAPFSFRIRLHTVSKVKVKVDTLCKFFACLS